MPRVITAVELPQTDDQLRDAFTKLQTRADVAALLAVSEKELIYILYRGGKQYVEFDTPKRAGGARHISAPTGSIKILQRRLNQVLRTVYTLKASVHGFAIGRSIVTNADRHVGKKVILNIDLEDFFPSIHFGRVRGLFATAHRLPLDVAQVLAQICVHNQVLPQGAPTSPIVSNMVCTRLDSGLRRLAQDHGCTYSRYADDITFSTTRSRLPEQIATVTVDDNGNRQVAVGTALHQVIEGNSFRINVRKVRLRVSGQRFEVTGLVVGRGVNVPREYVRGIRGLLHAWEKYGYDAAEGELRARHHRKHRRPGSPLVSLLAVAAGKLEFLRMVRGASDLVYTRLWNRFAALAGPEYKPKVALVQTPERIDAALWILESEHPDDPSMIRTGTAFALEGYGLVTCAHCLGKPPITAHQPGLILEPQRVTVTHFDADRDLARLLPPTPPLHALKLGTDTGLNNGDATIAAGYGNYALGGSSRLTKGHITGRGVRHGVPVIFSDHRAFEGNSGGPVLTPGLQVVGILERAVTTDAPGQETTILPISLLDEVRAVPPPGNPGA
jgi:RNA-directed DNA polymerase